MMTQRLVLMGLILLIAGCGSRPGADAADTPRSAADERQLIELRDRPLYTFNEQELDLYLRDLYATEPDFRRRMSHLARRNLRQPYDIYLLGEAPFEQHDDDPIYCLDRSDCVVYAEHVLAMAMADNWRDFLTILQRIRYNDGHISVFTRNHFTEADWNRNNRWLVRDITDEVGGAHVVRFTQRVDRARFFRNRYELSRDVPAEIIEESFIPYEQMESVKPLLRDGDVVNFVSGRNGSYWVGHVGMIVRGADGDVHLIHSARPAVLEEPMDDYIRAADARREAAEADGRAAFVGFKFLRPVDDPLANLRSIDGPRPRITVPENSPLTFEQYLDTFELSE